MPEEKIRYESEVAKLPPEILWHYTSSSAFLSMATNASLRFTDYRFLNDSSEFLFGVEVFTREMHKLQKVETDKKREILLERIIKEMERSRAWLRAYVFCMSPEDDSLTHWTSYSNKQEPIAIGFQSSSFTNFPWIGYRAELVSVIYDKDVQNFLAQNEIKSFLQLPQCLEYLRFDSTDIETIDFEVFILRCCDICVRFKNSKFSDEKEWRLVTRFGLEHGPFSELKFYSNGSGIIPCLDMVAQYKLLPIEQIMIGPRRPDKMQETSHMEFLLRHEYYNVKINASTLPIR